MAPGRRRFDQRPRQYSFPGSMVVYPWRQAMVQSFVALGRDCQCIVSVYEIWWSDIFCSGMRRSHSRISYVRLLKQRCLNNCGLVSVFSACLLYPTFATPPNIYLAASPNTATMLFCAIFYGECLRRTRCFLLPVMMVLWTNLHGGFLLGLLIVGLFPAWLCLDAIGRISKSTVSRASAASSQYSSILLAGTSMMA